MKATEKAASIAGVRDANGSKPGLAIAKALGTVKIDISAVTNGFVRSEIAAKGTNAGSGKAD